MAKETRSGCRTTILPYVVFPIITFFVAFIFSLFAYINVRNPELMWDIGVVLLISTPVIAVIAILAVIVNITIIKKKKYNMVIIVSALLYMNAAWGFFGGMAAHQ